MSVEKPGMLCLVSSSVICGSPYVLSFWRHAASCDTQRDVFEMNLSDEMEGLSWLTQNWRLLNQVVLFHPVSHHGYGSI